MNKLILFFATVLTAASAQAKIECVSASGKTSVDIYLTTNGKDDVVRKIYAARARVQDMNWITENLRSSLGEEVESAVFAGGRLWDKASTHNIFKGDVRMVIKEDIYDVVTLKSIPSSLVDEGEGTYLFKATLDIKFEYFTTVYPGYNKDWTSIQLQCIDDSGINDMPTTSPEM